MNDMSQFVCVREFAVQSTSHNQEKWVRQTRTTLEREAKSLRDRPIDELRGIATGLGIEIPARANRAVLAKRITDARNAKAKKVGIEPSSSIHRN